MKFPRTWDDKALLEDEPFLNAFSARAKARGSSNKDHDAWRGRVMVNLRKQTDNYRVVSRWYSLLPKQKKLEAQLQREEIIDVFFDFYHILSDNVTPNLALAEALTKHEERQTKTGEGFPLPARTVAGPQIKVSSVTHKNPPLKVQEQPPQSSVAKASHFSSTQSEVGQLAMPRRGRPANPSVKVEKSVNDDDLLQKSSSVKRRANESLPRGDKKQRLGASLDETTLKRAKRRLETRQRGSGAVGPIARPSELPDRRSSLRARLLAPRPTGIQEQKSLTRKAKKECIDDALSTQGAYHTGIKALHGNIVPNIKKARPSDDADDLDDDFDETFAKRKSRIDSCGRTILSAPSEQTGKKKSRRTLKRLKKEHSKLDGGPAILHLQDIHNSPPEETNVREALGDQKAPVLEATATKEGDQPPPTFSTSDETGKWGGRLRDRGPIPPNYSLTSRRPRAVKPSTTGTGRDGIANSFVVSDTDASVSSTLAASTSEVHQQIDISTPESSITTLAAVDTEGAETNILSIAILSSKCLEAASKEISDTNIGVTTPAYDWDSDERTETISQFSSPLSSPPPSSSAVNILLHEAEQADRLVSNPLIFPPPIPAAIDIALPETEHLDLPLTDQVAPFAICHDDILLSESEGSKEMALVSEMLAVLPAPDSQVPEPAESSQPLEMKPSLPMLPPIWAESRQEVCETFDWFRSYQGGVYHADDYVKGYLLSGFPASRDRFEHGGKFIISHGGGRAESLHSMKGNQISVPASDQLAADKSVRSLLNNYLHNRPLALLVDDKYALFPYDLGSKDIAYAVLGFYTVAYAWAEYQSASNEFGQVVRYKFAFRWCEEQGEPWWTKSPTSGDTARTTETTLSSSHQGDQTAEQLTDSFEKLALSRNDTPLPGSESGASAAIHPGRVLSNLFPSSRSSLTPGTTPKDDEEGRECDSLLSSTCCRTCGKDSPKVFSISWACLNADCSMFWRQTQSPELSFLPQNLTYDPNFLQLPKDNSGFPGFADWKLALSIHESAQGPGTGAVTDYHFTRGLHCKRCGRLSCRSQWEQWKCLHCGSITQPHIPIRRAGDLANQSLPISFDYYFVNEISDILAYPTITYIQQGGRGYLQSFILPHGRGKIHHIQARTRAAKVDADAVFVEYQEEAASGRMRFRRWPMRAHKCRGALLTNYFSHNAGEPYKYVGGDANTVPFDQAPAVCKARNLIQKRIHDALGISSTFNEVLSAAYMERQRMAFHSDNEVGLGPLVAGLSLGSPALMHFRLHARHDPQREQRGILLSVVLRHGDVLVMDGAGVQDFYEHTVVPNNFRIAATARQIGATHS